jgi:exosome complex component RRP40
MATTLPVVLPGDHISPASLPTPAKKNKALTLGPGLQHIPPDTIRATIAGALVTDAKKNAAWIEYNTGRYTPVEGDLVVATICNSNADNHNCTLSPHTPQAILPALAFEGATRKTRPVLVPNSIVYARIITSNRDTAPELSCVDPSTGKSEGLGPLKGGMVFNISLAMARRLLSGKKGGVSVLEGLSEKVGFEVAVGRNGVLWVDGGNVKTTLAVGRAVQEVDEKALGPKGQKKVVEKTLRDI